MPYSTLKPWQKQSVCPALTLPVRRVYNNGFVRNDSNHRYTTSRSTYADMLRFGWTGEGVVMCTP